MGQIINSILLNTAISIGYQVCMVISFIWLCWTSSNLVWLVFSDGKVDSMPQQASYQTVVTSPPINSTISLVSQLNLFGKPNTVTTAKKTKLTDIEAPETTLNLKLMGLRHGSGSIKSSAIIEGPDKKQNIYYLGDTLPSGNAVVEEIDIQRMIISRQGNYETLTLFTLLNSKNASQNTANSDSGIRHNDMTDNTFVTNKLIKYKALALQNPMALEGLLAAQPVSDAGKMRGYQLRSGDDSDFFSRAGLKPGDILTSVNDIKLDSESKLFSLIGDLSKASDVIITIERGGQPMTFRYNLK